MFKKGLVIKAKRIKPINFDCEAIILFSLFICGVILGVFLIKNCENDLKSYFSTILSNYISTKSECGILGCFSGVLVFLMIFIMIAFLFGLCAVGTPLVWCVPTVFGMFCSCYITLMLINYSFKGLLYFIIVDLLPYAITTATLVKCCCESTKISINLFSCIAGDNTFKGKNLFKEYIISYLILCLPVVIGALISSFCFKIFQSLFIFT